MAELGAVQTELPKHLSGEEAQKGIQGLLESMETLQPQGIANAIAYCITQPERVSISEILIRITQQPG